jgi:dihydroxyacetone kinase
MKKLINAPANYVDEMLDGLTLAYPSLVRDGASARVIRRASGARKGKVGIVSGGGSGHLPLFTGYVGTGLLDSCSIGNVFEGPNVASCVEAIQLADGGRGVLRLYGNYGGDRMNFDMAGELVEDEGIRTTTVVGNDDVASGGPTERARRRGVAGIIYAYKAAGATAEKGADLDEVTRIAGKAVAATRIDWSRLSPMLASTRDAMLARGGAKLGDKPVLDALDAVSTATRDLDDPSAIAAAATRAGQEALDRFARSPAASEGLGCSEIAASDLTTLECWPLFD